MAVATATKKDLYELSVPEIRERGKPFIEELAAVGVPAYMPMRPSDGKHIAMIKVTGAADNGRISLWPGAANISIYGDPEFRQAVVCIEEKARKITRDVTIRPNIYYTLTLAEIRRTALRPENFPIALPRNTKYSTPSKPKTVTKAKHSRPKDNVYESVVYTVTAEVPDSKISLLMGYDEDSLFVAALPSHVRSVKNAHAALRPKGTSPSTPRQGEWFFIPVSNILNERIDAEGQPMRENAVGGRRSVWIKGRYHRNLKRLESYSSHACHNIRTYNGKEYAKGVVTDLRKHHHKDLDLGDRWHEIARNNEVTMPVTATNAPVARQTNWD